MTSRQKLKGDRAERAVVEYLTTHGVPARRTRAGYERDSGDIHTHWDPYKAPEGVLQVKDCAAPRWAEWLTQLAEQRATAHAEVGALVVKRRGHADAGDWLVAMSLEDFVELLRRLHESPSTR